MNKSILAALALVIAVSLPAMASINWNQTSAKKNVVSLSTVGKSLESTLGIQQTVRSIKENPSNSKQAFLQPNPYQGYFDQNPSAKTELKIDLDSFDMEYVLKVQ